MIGRQDNSFNQNSIEESYDSALSRLSDENDPEILNLERVAQDLTNKLDVINENAIFLQKRKDKLQNKCEK